MTANQAGSGPDDLLSAADDYPLHQTPEPIAISGTDRNFYDRYFFCAQAPDGGRFLAAALGVYPQLDVMDAAFAWMEGGEQRSVFASRRLAGRRMDTAVGPVSVAVEVPLRRLRVRLAETGGLAADVVFEGRHPPVAEPRFSRRLGPRLLMDLTRMTQNVTADGEVACDGRVYRLSAWWGTRDRSWGIRPVGGADPQPPPVPPQFFWLWAPLNFPDHGLLFHRNDDALGRPWNRAMRLLDHATGSDTGLEDARAEVAWAPGTRRAAGAVLCGRHPDGGEVRARLVPGPVFLMHGLGYGHPRFGHGIWRGERDVAVERFEALAADPALPAHAHVQALVEAELQLPDGTTHAGRGVLEQLAIGPHAPSGFRELFDLA